MGRTAQILHRDQQFIGCWGYGGKLHGAKIWTEFDPPKLLASVSASKDAPALHEADAWAVAEGDRLILGREPFGKVPLYWTQVDSVIWFASKLQLLISIRQDIDPAALYGYSCFSYVPTPLTPIQSIYAIEAGTEQIWTGSDDTKYIRQWHPKRLLEWRESVDKIEQEETAIVQLQTLLMDATARQIQDITEPVGVLLSGGLDSAIVARCLVKSGVQVRAYSLDFGDIENPELPYAQQVADFLGIPLTKVCATPKRIRQALPDTIAALDLPFGDSVTVPLFLLSQAASQDVSIIFNGEGGDQLFGGWTNKPLIAASLYQPQISLTEQYLSTFHRLWGYESQVFQPTLYNSIQSIDPQHWIRSVLDSTYTPSLLHQLRRATLMLKGAQNIHPRASNLAWANGLKVRSLFCDLPLALWTFQLSGTLCLQGSCEKYILKRAVEDWLPSEIVWRQKRGMGVPLTAWCFNEWWSNLGDWLNPNVLNARQWQPHLASQIVSGQFSGQIQGRRIGEILWLLIMWEQWRSHYLGKPQVAQTWDHPFWMPQRLWKYGQQWKNSH
jgi:asparagine synthase (glutamine-hydrolysing)